jgi:histidine ammonia-lyase
MAIVIGNTQLSIDNLVRISRFNEPVKLHADVFERIRKCREMVEKKIQSREIMYGVNTGIGFSFPPFHGIF